MYTCVCLCVYAHVFNAFIHCQIHITEPNIYYRGQRPALTLNKKDDLSDNMYTLRSTYRQAHSLFLLPLSVFFFSLFLSITQTLTPVHTCESFKLPTHKFTSALRHQYIFVTHLVFISFPLPFLCYFILLSFCPFFPISLFFLSTHSLSLP